MAKKEKEISFQYLGVDFEKMLIATIIIEPKFGFDIIPILSPNYFTVQIHRKIIQLIYGEYQKNEVICDYRILEVLIRAEFPRNTISEDASRDIHLGFLEEIKKTTVVNPTVIKDNALNFCKQQRLQQVVHEIQEIIKTDNPSDYYKAESLLKSALEVGDNRDDSVDVFSNFENILEADHRDPIATGVSGLDEVMGGGLARGELAVVIAPLGVGKSTITSKIANTAFNEGKKVLQIFFEDQISQIQRKHLACWTGIEMNDLADRKEDVKTIVNAKKAEGKAKGGILKLVKMDGLNTRVSQIKQYIKKCIANGFKPDVVIIDYIDVINPDQVYKDTNEGQGVVMRTIESMCAELNFACWVAAQSNRSGIKAEVVEADAIGGSIKRAQIAHFIMSIARSIAQKEAKTANIAILKSRFGPDGIVWEDIKFNNGNLDIDTSTSSGPLSQSMVGNNKQSKADAIIKEMNDKKRQDLNLVQG